MKERGRGKRGTWKGTERVRMRNRKSDRQTDTQWHTSLILAFGKQRQGDG